MATSVAATTTFFWHDYETFGRVPRTDRPAQFAGVRTDMELREVAEPVVAYCQPAPDTLPDPESCLLTGITPADALAKGVPEHRFAQTVLAALSAPGTIGVGYNSIRFDEEVTRFLFWRNLIDPYEREWRNECGRWDLLDVLRLCFALRPEGIEWPRHEDGRASFKLEHFSAANKLEHTDAHDALSDVRATLALARVVRKAQPRLWDFALRLRKKQAVLDELAGAQARGEPVIHVSGRYGTERGCMALVWPLAPHPVNRNELIVWDLAQDPAALFTLNAAQIRERLFVAAEVLPEGVARLPIKTIRLNRAPMVIGNLKTLGEQAVNRWSINLDQVRRHAQTAAQKLESMAGIWPEVFVSPEASKRDVDEDLYGSFLSDEDRRRLSRLRAVDPADLASRQPVFSDDRLEELLFRYRARNFPDTLGERDHDRWEAHRVARLIDGAGGSRSLGDFRAALDGLAASHTSPRDVAILQSLRDYAATIDPRVPTIEPSL